jgi:hypothetical protein
LGLHPAMQQSDGTTNNNPPRLPAHGRRVALKPPPRCNRTCAAGSRVLRAGGERHHNSAKPSPEPNLTSGGHAHSLGRTGGTRRHVL